MSPGKEQEHKAYNPTQKHPSAEEIIRQLEAKGIPIVEDTGGEMTVPTGENFDANPPHPTHLDPEAKPQP